MKITKRLLALAFVFVLAFSFTACGDKEDDSTPLTTKRKQSSTTTAPAIDIWAYLNSEDGASLGGDLDGAEVPATVSSGKTAAKATYVYEDIPVSSGGSDVFSSATTSKTGYPTFKWNAVAGATKYNIYRSTSKNGTYSFIASTTATSYTDKTAVSGKKYYYKVKAVVKKAVTTTKTTTKKAGTTAVIPTKEPTVAQTTRNTANAPATAPHEYSTVNAIVGLYNTSANKVKTDAKAVTRILRTIKYVEDENNSSSVKALLTLGGFKETNDTTPQSFATPATIRDSFPVEGKNISSSLTEDMVKSATCTYSNGYYNVNIYLKDDPAKTTSYSGTCINVLNAAKYDSAAKSETKGARIQAKIYYNGLLDYVDQYAPTWVFINEDTGDIAVNGQCALSIEEFWSVNY